MFIPSVEDALRNIGSHFHRSYARLVKFQDLKEFFQSEIHRILGPANTRWLSLKANVDRILEQHPLKEYFRELLFTNPSTTTEDILPRLKTDLPKMTSNVCLMFWVFSRNSISCFDRKHLCSKS